MSQKEGCSNLNYDEVLEYIGQFGSFQKRIFFALWLVSAAGGIAVMVFAFTGELSGVMLCHVGTSSLSGLEPNYRCRVPQCEGSNASYYGAPSCDISDPDCDSQPQLPAWFDVSSIGPNDRCRKRVPTPGLDKEKACGAGGTKFVDAVDGLEEQCDYDELVFDRTIMTHTLIEEYQLLCGR